jgi:WD40 repeat protein
VSAGARPRRPDIAPASGLRAGADAPLGNCQTAVFKKGRAMTRRKKGVLLAIVTLAFVSPLFVFSRGPRPRAGEDRPPILEGHQFPVRALAFAPDGTSLTSAAGFANGPREEVERIVWDVRTGRPRTTHAGFQGNLSALSLSPDGTAMATAGGDGAVRLWDCSSVRERARLAEHRAAVCAVALSADGCRAASADRDNNLMLWDIAGKRLWACPSGHDRFVLALAFAPDGRTLASGGTDTTVRLWDVDAGKERAALPGQASCVTAVAFSPDGRTLAAGDRAGVVKLWDVATGTERASLAVTDPVGQGRETVSQRGMRYVEEVAALAFAPHGRTLAGAIDETVRLWDVATGESVASLTGHQGKVHCLVFSPDGKLLASGGHDQTVRLWDVARH